MDDEVRSREEISETKKKLGLILRIDKAKLKAITKAPQINSCISLNKLDYGLKPSMPQIPARSLTPTFPARPSRLGAITESL